MSDDTSTHAGFEEFWLEFVLDHPSAANRWAHVFALASGVAGTVTAIRTRRVLPLLIGAAGAFAGAVGGHRLFQGDAPRNLGRPAWGARGFLRLCARTITGSVHADFARAAEARARAQV